VEERSYDYPDEKAPEPRKRPLWIILLTILAVGILFPVLIIYSPFNIESDPFFPFLSNHS